MNTQCRVEHDLGNYELKQDQLEKAWEATLIDKRQAVIDLAKKILNQDVDKYTFETAFSTHYDFDDDVDYEILISSLTEIESETCIDVQLMTFLAGLALDGAVYCLYDIPLSELYSEGYGERNMIKEVLD